MGIGFFLKVFVADTLAYVIDQIYGNLDKSSGILILIATLFFGMQIYCDFNGYSLIARGCAKILGVDLIKNFERPYFSKSISEFWRKWHISLSFWFRDYVYIPFGGNRCSKGKHYFNLFLTFLLSGLWHGANWTFTIWGGLNGIYLIIEDVFGINKGKRSRIKNICGLLYTYLLVNLSWIFFRARSFNDIGIILEKIVSIPLEAADIINHKFILSGGISIGKWDFAFCMVGIMSIFFLSIYEKRNGDICLTINKVPSVIRWIGYFLLIFVALCFGKFGDQSSQFVYFRF
jgi:D-alanyl-lipoteichoic acid acyltransferase DltB (MBOAT superfamily)